jgi:hypothetical protein
VQLSPLTKLFRTRYSEEGISIFDKVDIYKFFNENKENLNLSKNMVNDFVTLIKYLNNKRKEKSKEYEIKEEDKIVDVINNNLKNSVKPEFIELFKDKDGLTVNKAANIFNYYMKTIFENIKTELDKYKEKLSNDSKKTITEYYDKDSKKIIIGKKDLACSIRLFATLVLSQEKDKKNKIQANHNNFINYFKNSELWDKDLYDNPNFNKNLNEIKSWNIQISQVISLYEHLGKDFDKNYFNDVIERINNEKAANKTIADFNIKEDQKPKKHKEPNEQKKPQKELNEEKNQKEPKESKEQQNHPQNDKNGDEEKEEEDDPFAEKDPDDEDDPFAKKDNSDDEE